MIREIQENAHTCNFLHLASVHPCEWTVQSLSLTSQGSCMLAHCDVQHSGTVAMLTRLDSTPVFSQFGAKLTREIMQDMLPDDWEPWPAARSDLNVIQSCKYNVRDTSPASIPQQCLWSPEQTLQALLAWLEHQHTGPRGAPPRHAGEYRTQPC